MREKADSRAVHPLVPLTLAVLLLIGAAIVPALLVTEQARVAERVANEVVAHNELMEMLSDLQNAETGQRGFLLRGDHSYLVPYEAALAALPDRFASLEANYAKSAEASSRLAELKAIVANKLAELKQTIDLKRAGDDRGALDVLKSDRGQHLMDDSRRIIADLRAKSQAYIDVEQSRLARMGVLVEAAIVAAIVAAIAAAGFVLLDARRRELRLEATVGDLAAANAALSDAIARRTSLEKQLRQSQKMEAIGQLTGGLAHDFNNMLAVILSSIALMRRKLQRGDHDVESYMALVADGAHRAANLTQRLLSFARRQPLAPEIASLNKVLPGLTELLRRTLGEAIEFESVLAGGLWYAKVDVHQLENAVVNLAVNARDAMPEGGKLTIETANACLDEAYAAQHVEVRAGQYVLIAVSDSGTGMSQAVLTQAFDPFFTTKGVGHGTGLGLSQVYGFVKQSGGHIEIYSEAGAGTTVKLYLPRSLEEPARATVGMRATEVLIPHGDPQKTILVVEDEDSVRRLTVDSLRDLNYTVIHAKSGAEALRIFERGHEVSLLLTDVVMPQLNGKQLVDKARALRPEIKALYMTGFSRNAIVHNGVVDRGVQMITKPFTLEQLAAKVHACIAGD